MTLESRRERAERFLDDRLAAFQLSWPALVTRQAHATSTIRALWVSRRKWRAVAEQQAARIAELEEDNAHLRNAQHDAQLNGGAQ